MCWMLFFPTKHPVLVVEGEGAAGGHLNWILRRQISKIQSQADAVISVWQLCQRVHI